MDSESPARTVCSPPTLLCVNPTCSIPRETPMKISHVDVKRGPQNPHSLQKAKEKPKPGREGPSQRHREASEAPRPLRLGSLPLETGVGSLLFLIPLLRPTLGRCQQQLST